MKSLSVSSVCDHSWSVYLEPTSTGTVRHPATERRYSRLMGGGGGEESAVKTLKEKGKKLLVQDSTIVQKYIICAPLGVFLLLLLLLCHQKPASRMSAVSGERREGGQ